MNDATMTVALNLEPRSRGTAMLIHHCMALGRSDAPRVAPAARVEQAVGTELAWLLLFALAGPQGRRGSSSP